ncbi:MAG: hypothetical protein JWO08_3352 [Verrucomicrobiaceae bacterium]|nr:hypothetical protein [Verrucomicrobiaceae bacterium]
MGELLAVSNDSRQPGFGGPASSGNGIAPWSAGHRIALSGSAGAHSRRLMVGRGMVPPVFGCAPVVERHRTEPVVTSCQIIHPIQLNPAQVADRAVAVVQTAVAVVTVTAHVAKNGPPAQAAITM